MKVLIATPLHGSPVPQYTEAVIHTRDILEAELRMLPSPLLAHARNELAQRCLQGGYDVMLFADSDERWYPSDARTLCFAAERFGVAGAPVPFKKRDWASIHRAVLEGCSPEQLEFQGLRFNYRLRREDVSAKGYVGPRTRIAQTEFVRVLSLGTGLLAISRKALEATLFGRTMYTRDRERFVDLFPMGPRDEQYQGEDIGFCRIYGGDIWMAKDMRVQHYGLEAFEGVANVDADAVDTYVAGGGSQ